MRLEFDGENGDSIMVTRCTDKEGYYIGGGRIVFGHGAKKDLQEKCRLQDGYFTKEQVAEFLRVMALIMEAG